MPISTTKADLVSAIVSAIKELPTTTEKSGGGYKTIGDLIDDHTDTGQADQLYDYWEKVVDKLVDHLKNNTKVLISDSMKDFKTALGSAIVKAQDGGANLKLSLTESSWYSDNPSTDIE